MTHQLKPPFPYYGNKRRAAPEIWRRFGDVDRYLEPFAGALGCLLARPGWRRDHPWTETVNDINGHITNVWRAIRADPDEVWRHADRVVSEIDLRAAQLEVARRSEDLVAVLIDDLRAFDAELAGLWVWGASAAIAGNWQNGRISRPQLAQNSGRASRGVVTRFFDPRLFNHISERLHRVTILCGDWSRCLSTSCQGLYQDGKSQGANKIVGVMLDPPYDSSRREQGAYAHDDGAVALDARSWALKHDDDPRFRIALCGMRDEHVMPPSWERWAHKGNQGTSGVKTGGECVWFSPHCRGSSQQSLFS